MNSPERGNTTCEYTEAHTYLAYPRDQQIHPPGRKKGTRRDEG